MDEFEAFDKETVWDRLKDPRAVDRLHTISSESMFIDYSTVPLVGTVVAGTGIELGQPGICGTLRCRKPTLDSDLGSLLHYFDYVVMQGPDPRSYRRYAEQLADRQRYPMTRLTVARDVACLQYLRQSEITKHVVFANKPGCFCDRHFKEHADALGLTEFTEPSMIADMAQRLTRKGLVSVEKVDPGAWYGYITRPVFLGSIGKRYEQEKPPSQATVANDIIKRDLMSMVFDGAAARMMGLPMASLAVPGYFETVPGYFETERGGEGPRTIEEVAAHLTLPILSNLKTAEVVRLRERHSADFEAFRSALREAISTTMERMPDVSPQRIAETAWQEQLKPALADLERRISVNRRSLALGSGTMLTIGSVTTAVASAVTAPWAAALLGAAVASTLPVAQISEYLKERKQINMSSMYFLWRAQKMQDHY
ncbi:hypothetical protein [Micromonospora sp. KC213]|uniref:hypothetical protein n=1 Tax=Micromonospora sp. KC213 TaxID=2530378 RepID=UPI00104C46F6|nr:hypothetical protein [Micromonospora sp. KC213]TDC32888.1 hypothetical protein E1166_26245 [Micromonospora sp. KC213]